MDKSHDHYQVLGISKTASLPEIKKAYREKALEFHPDRNPNPEAHEKFKAIQRAYDVLSDPVSKLEYDEGKKSAVTDNPKGFLKGFWVNIIKHGLTAKGR